MIDEYIHPWDSPWEQINDELPTILATPEQVLTGIPIGAPNSQAKCTDCSRTLREGESVLVYAYRTADTTEWDTARCYCQDCRSATISAPALGTSEMLVDAALGAVSDVRQQNHQYCLLAVDPIDASPPTEGTPP